MIRKHLSSIGLQWLAILGIPLIYWSYSRSYSGPAYLSDEIGYLSNAIFLAGYYIDGASSWHAGYSFLLSPLFRIFSDVASIWAGAMMLNALLWVLSFYLLDRLMVIWCPNINEVKRILILLFVGAYPAWMTMSGYVFTTPAFVVFYLAGLVNLASIKEYNCKNIFPFTILVGLLYWIHPAGLAVAGASIIVVSIWSIRNRSYSGLFFHAIGVVVLILAYKFGIHPWLADGMTPAGYRPITHYPSLSKVFARIGGMNYWLDKCAQAIGQISYLTVGSFGLAFFGFSNLFVRAKRLLSREHFEQGDVAGGYAIFSCLSVIAIGVIALNPRRIDHWIYGRYLDQVSMPVIAVGAMSLLGMKGRTRIISTVLAVCIVVGAGFLTGSRHIVTEFNNLINTPAFWPQYVFPQTGMLSWMALGALAIGAVGIGGKYVALLAVLSSFVASSINQSQWHLQIQSFHSKPSSIVDIVRANYTPGACVGFDTEFPDWVDLYRKERFQLYKFYFYDYGYRRISIKEWRNGCDGPLLTYNPQQFIGKTTENVLARENDSGLFLVVKDGMKKADISAGIRLRSDISLATTMDDACLLSGCYAVKYDELIRFSQVGVIRDGMLSSDGRAGYLFYGPYRALDKGFYSLVIRGNFFVSDTAVIEIASDQGKKIYLQRRFSQGECSSGEALLPFQLEEKTTGLEVRLRVGSKDRVSIMGYEIVAADVRHAP
jgi:hypothetical protein